MRQGWWLIYCIGIWMVTVINGDSPICPEYPPISDVDKSVFEPILNEIDNYIENVIVNPNENNITGFITSIVYDQELLFSKGYGLKNYFNKSSGIPTGNDEVMIASNTKVFTSLLFYYLRDHGYNVSLQDPLTKYLPDFKIKNPFNGEQTVRLIHLISHTAGLPDETPYPYTDSSDNVTAILEALSQKYLLYPMSTTFHYSNLGFSLLGRALETLFCEYGCYEDLVKKYILDGLGFSKYSGFNYSDEVIEHCAIGIDNGGYPAPIETSYFDNPNGGMLASANDMAKFMMFMFRNNYTVNDNSNQIFNGTTINEILKGRSLLNDGFESVGTPFEMHYAVFDRYYGINNKAGVWFKGKQGEVPGYRSCTMMVPKYKLGVFTVALKDPENISQGSVSSDEIIKMILPYLDNQLYLNWINTNKYELPSNYPLLIGKYKIGSSIIEIIKTNAIENGKEYLVFRRSGNDEYRLNIVYNKGIIDDTVLVSSFMDNDVTTCFWYDSGGGEYLYFDFNNNKQTHATSFTFEGSKYTYQG